MANKAEAQAAKERGNKAFAAGDFPTAVREFTAAIAADPTDHVFYSNRSGAYVSMGDYEKALQDANSCIAANKNWAKGYSRKGTALMYLKKYKEAKEAYQEGLKIEPANQQCKEGVEDAEQRLQASSGLGALFGEGMWAKLQMDPVTREYLKDPKFVQKMKMLQANPQLMSGFAQDPQLASALGVLLGIGAQGFSAGPGGPGDEDGAGPGAPGGPAGGRPEPQAAHQSPQAKPQQAPPKQPEPPAQEVPGPDDMVDDEMDEEEKAELERKRAEEKLAAENRKKADAVKEQGNNAYKAKKFDEAVRFYEQAAALDPTNATVLNNIAAVLFEQKEYAQCVAKCKEALAIGAKHRVDFKTKAKSWTRMGSAYVKLGDLKGAEEAYQQALLEDGDEKTRKELKKIKARREEEEKAAYLSEEKSEQHKANGNQLFQEGKWVDAIAEYSEALKRWPKNYKVYSNRAACYAKLLDWQRALEDCDACLAIDPSFVKIYIRKGKVQHFLKQYHKALDTFDKGLQLDPNCDELIDAKRQTQMAINEENASGKVDPQRAKEAMKDPEIQAILADPTVNNVLRMLQEDPKAAQNALRDATIMAKIEKLVAAGILSVGPQR